MKHMVILLSALLITLTSCGNSSNKLAMDQSAYNNVESGYTTNGSFGYFADTEAEEVYADVSEDTYYSTSLNDTAGKGASSLASNRKLIREASLDMETKEYEMLLTSLEKQIADAGGYIQSAQSQGNAEYSNRWMYYVLRIPEAQYDTFLAGVNTLGTVISRNENVTDVTLSYTDTESRIKALETEYATLLTILEKCESLNDVITVQSRITEVTYQLENYKSTLRTYDNQVAYCTICLTVSEVQKITESQKNLSIGERMKRDILSNWADLGDDALDFVVWFVSVLPVLIVLGGGITLFIILIRRTNAKRRKNLPQNTVPQYIVVTPENKPNSDNNNTKQ